MATAIEEPTSKIGIENKCFSNKSEEAPEAKNIKQVNSAQVRVKALAYATMEKTKPSVIRVQW